MTPGWQELLIIAVILIALFGWKKLPDMARSLGRSARVFKSEVDEMKKDGRPTTDSVAQTGQAGWTVPGDLVERDAERAAAEARLAEAEAKAAEARAEAERLRRDSAS